MWPRTGGPIEDLNLFDQAGEKLGIVGASGAGKSTLVSFCYGSILRKQGSILIDGQGCEGQVTSKALGQIGMGHARKNRYVQPVGPFRPTYATVMPMRPSEVNAPRPQSRTRMPFIESMQDQHGPQRLWTRIWGERGVEAVGRATSPAWRLGNGRS